MRKLLITFTLWWLFCLPAAANSITMSGVGEIDFGPNITVTEGHDNKGSTVYNFKVKDGEVWRGATLFPPYSFPNSDNVNGMINLDALLDKMIDEKASKDESILTVDKAELLKISSKKVASKSVRISRSNSGFIIVNMNTLLLSTDNGIKMLMFVCADGDVPYWRPVLYKIVSKIP